MKRIIALLCALSLILSMAVYAVEAAPVISADDVTTELGGTVDVPIRITGNTGILGAKITVQYAEGLTLTKVTKGDAFAELTMTKPGNLKANPVNIVWDGESDAAEADGVIVILTFLAPQKAGSYPITITAERKNIVDADLNDIEVETKKGTVTVGCKTHKEVIDAAVEPTCTEPGLTAGKHCSVCGVVLVAQIEIPAKGHTWTAASCTAPRSCSSCGATDGEPLGHDWGAWTVTTEATCTEKGEETRRCQREGCTAAESKELPAKGHTEVIDAAVEPTCTETGLTAGKHCAVCKAVLVEQTEIPAKGHTEVIDAAVEPTCTEPGLTAGKHCAVCKAVLVEQTEIPAKGHTWTAASCTAPRSCSSCGATDGEPLGHDWSAWTVTTEATCTEKGEETRRCQREGCTAAESKELPAKGHTEVIDAAVEPTCTEPGLTAGKHCAVCKAVLVEQTEIPAKGHTAGEPVRENVIPATKDEAGSYDEVVYCTVCNAEISRVAKKIPQENDDRPTYPVISVPSKPPVFPFRDVPESAWYYDAVKSAWKVRLIDGVTATEFQPDNNMTVAQAIKLAAALHQMNHRGRVSLKNGSPDWYSTYVKYAIENGLIEQDYDAYTDAQMNGAVTRAEFVHIFYRAADNLREMNAIADNAIPDVKLGDTFAAEIYNFYRAGILTGSDANGTFHPTDSIKRSEVAAILIRMYDSGARRRISLE